VSHVAVHDYSCDEANTMAYLKAVYDRYKKPVWLTEFSCGDGADAKPMSEHLAYMKKIVPLLDGADFVFRYAWMSAKSANRGLFNYNGSTAIGLTEVGALYKSL